MAGSWRRPLAAIPRVILAALLALAILDMLAGVLLRYIGVPVTDYFDLPGISLFWVEEGGEFALAWLTLLGAGLALFEGTHFALSVLTQHLPGGARRVIDRVNHLLIAGFGVLVAIYGWRISQLNATLTSPGLGINLAWLYFAAVVGGISIAVYGAALAMGAVRPRAGKNAVPSPLD